MIFQTQRRQRNERFQKCCIAQHSLAEGWLWFVPVSLTMDAQNLFKNGTVNGQRHRDEILAPYVVLYAGAVVQEFILMDDNATAHCCLIE